MTNSRKEPIAIVGIGCRFPGGANSPKAFWNLLRKGKDAIVDVPKDRWDSRKFYDPNPDKPGKMYVKQGGFLKEKIDQFDPLFFGISPREAESMDPQQRLLLEVSWEAFEDAGITEEELKGSKTGVFIGGFCLDNQILRFGAFNRDIADSHSAASSTMTILSNRISHVFDLKGPSVTMDTACSSSLVATHYACNSIWNGESNAAITGGVNVMLRPEFPIVMSKGKFLSPHGRCMAFDENAAGYARGEGAGVMLLKALSEAVRNGDRIYGLIKETGVNQDGHTSGISLPNTDAQEALVRDVYARAGVSPSDISYIEAHGTGTQAGDPAELRALNAVLSENRETARACIVGTVKTNIGHLEAAAGIAGLIKAVLSLHHEKIVPNLHFNKPNPKIPFSDYCIQVSTKLRDWKRENKIRYAGVNSFGYGGTNAHALLQEAPLPNSDADPKDNGEWRKPYLLPISAKAEGALRELASKYAFLLSSHSDPKWMANLLFTTTKRRSHHPYRLAIVAASVEELRLKLQQYSAGEQVEQASTDRADPHKTRELIFIYTGMGPQWWGMGRELMKQEPVFLRAIEECDELFVKEAGWSILEALKADESQSRMSKTEVAQPANFVIQVGLTALWKSWGIEPSSVIGHSVGEVTAAFASGALSLEHAIKVSFHRSRLQQSLAGKGAMLAAGIGEEQAIQAIAPFDKVSIAAINSPNSVTLSGDPHQIDRISENLQERGVFNRKLEVEVAYHSSQMDDIKDELLASLASLEPTTTTVPLYSSVTGGQIEGESLSADYWWQNVRESVRFCQGIESILGAGGQDFLEVGPHPVLGHSVKEIALNKKTPVRLIPSLNRKCPEHLRMLESLGQLYACGFRADWQTVLPEGHSLIDLPSYPWQKERYWSETQASLQDRLGSKEHPFLNTRTASPIPSWETEVGHQYFPYIDDHKVNGEIVFPGAAYVDAGLAVHKEMLNESFCALEDVTLHNILFFEAKKYQLLNLSYDSRSMRFSVHGKEKHGGDDWKLYANGRLLKGTFNKLGRVNINKIKEKNSQTVSPNEMYKHLAKRGLDYGENFRRAKEVHFSQNEILVKLQPSEICENDRWEYLFHPTLLDAALHSVLFIIPGNATFVPVSFERIYTRASILQEVWCHGRVLKITDEELEASLCLFDVEGNILAKITKVHCRSLSKTSELVDLDSLLAESRLEQLDWANLAIDEPADSCLIFSDTSQKSNLIESKLKEFGISVRTVTLGDNFVKTESQEFKIDRRDEGHYEQLLGALKSSGFNKIIYLWPLAADAFSTSLNEMVAQSMSLTRLAKALDHHSIPCSITVVTAGLEIIDPEDKSVNLNLSPLPGLTRLIENEFEKIKCSLVDLPLRKPIEEIDDLIKLLIAPLSGQFALRQDRVYATRLAKIPQESSNVPESDISESTEEPIQLGKFHYGQLESLCYERFEKEEPNHNEVEIKVHYTALNYKDVLKCFGSIPKEALDGTYFGQSIGMEVSGTVSRKGNDITEIEVGDRVVAATIGGFKSYVRVPQNAVLKKPSKLDMCESPVHIVFGSAYFALDHLAKLQPNESVLIHSATGGLGLAAIQIAKKIGATIYATAGTQEKRDYLLSLGIEYVMDSRTLDFADEIQRYTEGKGVDVVLNTLPGDGFRKSLSVLADYGRFIEMGKMDIAQDSELSLSIFNRNIGFFSFDFDRMYRDRPEYVRNFLESMQKNFEDGTFEAIPISIFKASDIKNAFQHMARGKHIGKIVVKFAQEYVPINSIHTNSNFISKTSCYLVTGGTRGFGLEVAKWLANNKAGRLVLVSLSGASSTEAKNAIAEMEKAGTKVSAIAIDIADRNATKKLFDMIGGFEEPLKGIIHGAMVLDDGFLRDLSEERFLKVMSPKIAGALNLADCPDKSELDFFALFSSISSLVGNRGQGNYIAANGFLDYFSKALRLSGIRAFAINWGAIADSGIVARNETLQRVLDQEGIKGISSEAALQAFERAIAMECQQVGIFDIDWQRWRESNPKGAESFMFSELADTDSSSQNDSIDPIAAEHVQRMMRMNESERSEYTLDLMKKRLSEVLKINIENIDSQQSLDNLGIDSLLLLELAINIRNEIGVQLSTMDILKASNLADLSEAVASKLLGSELHLQHA